MPFISKDRVFWKQMYPGALSQEKSFPILEIQFSLGKPPSAERKLGRRFIIHESFLGVGSLPAGTLLSVFSDFCTSIKNFNSWSLSGWWASRYRSKHPAKLLSFLRKNLLIVSKLVMDGESSRFRWLCLYLQTCSNLTQMSRNWSYELLFHPCRALYRKTNEVLGLN